MLNQLAQDGMTHGRRAAHHHTTLAGHPRDIPSRIHTMDQFNICLL